MNHPDEARLNDYADGLLDNAAAADVAAHLAGCEACRERVEAIRSLTDRLAALPTGIPPSRDLRPGIRDRLARATPDGSARRAWLRAAAAVAVLAGAAAAAWLGLPSNEATAPGPEDPIVAAYAEAADELAAALEARRSELSPEAAGALDAGLSAVNAAIRELERARARGAPGDALDRHLEGRYRTKLALLRGAVARLEES